LEETWRSILSKNQKGFTQIIEKYVVQFFESIYHLFSSVNVMGGGYFGFLFEKAIKELSMPA